MPLVASLVRAVWHDEDFPVGEIRSAWRSLSGTPPCPNGNPRPFVRVFGVASVRQIEGLERNLFGTAQPMLDQVRARELALAGKGIATKQIARRAIFLDENDYMLNQPAECYGFADSMPRTRGMCIKSKQR